MTQFSPYSSPRHRLEAVLGCTYKNLLSSSTSCKYAGISSCCILLGLLHFQPNLLLRRLLPAFCLCGQQRLHPLYTSFQDVARCILLIRNSLRSVVGELPVVPATPSDYSSLALYLSVDSLGSQTHLSAMPTSYLTPTFLTIEVFKVPSLVFTYNIFL
jgi:hypothetical protein